ncbi:unnamed protein product [Ambrosiozyma monospora]|uniref:Unnamed protein product n=1 Tax=Ambrosiozyma monospora TaxID=43982 RepID=A0A9W6YZ55_AMBMO|nr:unnamed protein product [Ambrosiozyma monospora]
MHPHFKIPRGKRDKLTIRPNSTSPSPSPSVLSPLGPLKIKFNVRYPEKTEIFSSIHRRVKGNIEIYIPSKEYYSIESIDVGFKGDVRTRINERISSSQPAKSNGFLSSFKTHKRSSSNSSPVKKVHKVNKDGVVYVLFDESFNIFKSETSPDVFNIDYILTRVPFEFMFPSFEKDGDLRLPSSGDSFCYADSPGNGEANTTVRYELYVRVRALSSPGECYNIDFLAPLKYQGGSLPPSGSIIADVEMKDNSDESDSSNDVVPQRRARNSPVSPSSHKSSPSDTSALNAICKFPSEILLDDKLGSIPVQFEIPKYHYHDPEIEQFAFQEIALTVNSEVRMVSRHGVDFIHSQEKVLFNHKNDIQKLVDHINKEERSIVKGFDYIENQHSYKKTVYLSNFIENDLPYWQLLTEPLMGNFKVSKCFKCTNKFKISFTVVKLPPSSSSASSSHKVTTVSELENRHITLQRGLQNRIKGLI